MVNKMLSPGPFPRRPMSFIRYLAVSVLLLYTFFAFHRSSRDISSSSALLRPLPDASLAPASALGKIASKPTFGHQSSAEKPMGPPPLSPSQHRHPIDKLIDDAQQTFTELMHKETHTVEQAARAYRERRGRHPPPGFDKWHKFARSHNAVIVEDFFDQIHHDVEPFWGMDPLYLRRRVSQAEMTITVREGNASTESDWFWTQIWLEMMKKIDVHLPDMDIPLNAMDEPRLVVPWEDINGYMSKAAKTVNLPDANTVLSSFQKLPAPKTGELGIKVPDIEWEGTSEWADCQTPACPPEKLTFCKEPYWSIVRRACPADSPAREAPLQESFAHPPVISNKFASQHLHDGYVANYTKSVELCHQPDLQGLEGILIEPISTSATKTMFPMFGGSKLNVNNEILLPAPMYWSEEERFTGGGDLGVPWARKKNKAVWRGVATGGKNRETNWRGFQRHRFVSMSNGTKVTQVESREARAENFALPDDEYHVRPQEEGRLGAWVGGFSDVAFIDLFCEPQQDGRCNYTDFYFEPQATIKLAEQFNSKFLPDIDGNSFSGRYLGFLRSTSLPIKATVWREWHDSRLVAWKHFVPMDNRFSDYYGIMEYFLGYEGRHGHDAAAEKIATAGKEWAERVLRKEDMLVYVMRLLLEYARILDDRRESMGWVDDLLEARKKYH